jgi:hypothetical protein
VLTYRRKLGAASQYASKAHHWLPFVFTVPMARGKALPLALGVITVNDILGVAIMERPSLIEWNAAEAAMQRAAGEFLASYSAFLSTASLLERRPWADALHPNAETSISIAQWHLAAAIREIDTIRSAGASLSRVAGGTAPKGQLPRVVRRAIEEKILVQWPEAEEIVKSLPEPFDLQDAVGALWSALLACRTALEAINLHSKARTWQLHSALSIFADTLVKGQYIAIARLGRQ